MWNKGGLKLNLWQTVSLTVLLIVLLAACLVYSVRFGIKANEVKGPTRLVRGPEGSVNVYVYDRLLRADGRGNYLETIDISKDLGQEGKLMDFAFTPGGGLLAAFEGSEGIHLYDRDLNLVRTLEIKSTELPKEFTENDFVKLALGSLSYFNFTYSALTNSLYFSDSRAGKVSVYDSGFNKTSDLAPPKGFNWPTYVVVEEGRILVSDSSNFRVLSFGLEGTFREEHTVRSEVSGTPRPTALAFRNDVLYVINKSGHAQKDEVRAVPLVPDREHWTIRTPEGLGEDAVPRGILALEDSLLVTYEGSFALHAFGLDGAYRGSFGDQRLVEEIEAVQSRATLYKVLKNALLGCMLLLLASFLVLRKLQPVGVDKHITSTGEDFAINEGEDSPAEAPDTARPGSATLKVRQPSQAPALKTTLRAAPAPAPKAPAPPVGKTPPPSASGRMRYAEQPKPPLKRLVMLAGLLVLLLATLPLLFYSVYKSTAYLITRGKGPVSMASAVAPEGSVYMLFNKEGVLYKVSEEGSVLGEIDLKVPGQKDHEAMRQLKVDRAGRLYISLPARREIRVYSPEGESLGEHKAQASAVPEKNNYFHFDIVPDQDSLLLSEPNTRRVALYNAAGGRLMELKPEHGFKRPEGVTLSEGRYVVLDPPDRALYLFSPGGEVLSRWHLSGLSKNADAGDLRDSPLEWVAEIGSHPDTVSAGPGAAYLVTGNRDRNVALRVSLETGEVKKLDLSHKDLDTALEGTRGGSSEPLYVLARQGDLLVSFKNAFGVYRYSHEGEMLGLFAGADTLGAVASQKRFFSGMNLYMNLFPYLLPANIVALFMVAERMIARKRHVVRVRHEFFVLDMDKEYVSALGSMNPMAPVVPRGQRWWVSPPEPEVEQGPSPAGTAGKTVCYGGCVLSARGLGKGKATVPWGALTSVGLEGEGAAVVRFSDNKGKGYFLRLPLEQSPECERFIRVLVKHAKSAEIDPALTEAPARQGRKQAG